ncbi:hypothetical protein [Clostridium sp. CH2]|uniref:hypothetical protein n=1 Tax=Clostridium sp. CH2 TaxID=2949990 RepID=UPI00207A8954|nr:hypothetical protein [Clostridium sp. CH2]
MNKYTIVINDGLKRYKVSKIVFYGDGGFSVLSPYHTAKKGYLGKLIIDHEEINKHIINVKVEDNVEYSAEDRVKLSVHPDGFVQFSGENPQKIISGKEKETGEPKGLGLFTNPLSHPIESGPTFGLMVWGMDEFVEFISPKKGEKVIEFNMEDIHNRDCSTTDFNAYLIEGFVFKNKERKQIQIVNNNHVINKYSPNYREERNEKFSYRVVNLAHEKYVVTLLVSRIIMDFDEKSGFSLNSPQQIKDGKNIGLFCLYPSSIIPRDTSNSLDYK